MEFDITTLKPGEGLTMGNFFDKATQEFPLAMGMFTKWIDKYKALVKWNSMFVNRNKCRHVSCKPDFMKFHELPFEMQVGVLFTFFRETIEWNEGNDLGCDFMELENIGWYIVYCFKELQAQLDVPTCRVCGCTDNNACIHPVHGNCSWAEADLCSNCKNYPGEAKLYSELYNK